MSRAAAPDRPSWPERILDGLDRLVPKPAAWAFALRIWLAMIGALYAAFWLQLDSASSAAVCVAILAQPRRGQALSKAFYRFLGTVIGGVVALVLMGLFNEDRVLLLVAFSLWLGVCVFVAQYLQDTRAYGAMLSGYTVAIIALAHIDSPQNTFDAAVGRLAAITVGIVAITFINDALASPSTWPALRGRLADATGATKRFCADALRRGDPGSEPTADLIRRIAAMRADASAVAGELDDGPHRAAGARSAIAALYVMAAATRALCAARARLPDPGPAVEEAVALCREIAAGGVDGPGPDRLDAIDARLRALVDAAVRDGQRPLDETMALQRALDVCNAATFAEDGLRALGDGHRPLRDAALPTHRDFAVAWRGAVRVVIAFAVTAAFCIASGLPQTSFALVQVAATCALSSVAPDPQKFAIGVLIGMPVAAACAVAVLFFLVAGNQGFPLLALAMAPVVFVACFLSLNPPTFGTGFILLVFFPALLAPDNPQSYDPQTVLMNGALVTLAVLILFLTVRLVLPVSPARHRAFALAEARRDLAGALRGEGGDGTTRTSLNSDRLLQFSQWNSGSGAVRRASLGHAFAMARLESAAARAHAQLRALARVPALAEGVARGRAALAACDAPGLEDAARALIGAGGLQPPATRMTIARAGTDLATAARVVEGQGRFFRRLALPNR